MVGSPSGAETVTRGRAKDVSRRAYRTYLRKATDFQEGMELAKEEGHPNSAALCAVHATIAAADALVSFHLGVRSTAQGHEEVTELMRQTKVAGVDERANQVRDVLGLKNRVEYEDREPTVPEVERLCLQATRVLAWVRGHLPTN